MAGYEAVDKEQIVWAEQGETPGNRTHFYVDPGIKLITTNEKPQKHIQPHLLNQLNKVLHNETL